MKTTAALLAALSLSALVGCEGVTMYTQVIDGDFDGAEAQRVACDGGHELIVEGDLIVSDQASVEAARCVVQVYGDVLVQGSELTYLEGLDDLRIVAGDVSVDSNRHLMVIDGLTGLEFIGGDLRVTRNDRLEYVTDAAMGDLSIVGGDLIVSGVYAEALSNLRALDYVGGDLTLRHNAALVDIASLHGLEAVGGDLVLTENEALSDAAAEALVDAIGEENIGGDIDIDGGYDAPSTTSCGG